MSLSLYDVTVPVFLRGFGSLSHCLAKGRAFADEKGLPHAALLEARLFPDMFPLTAQVQRASDAAKFTVTRVGERPNKAMDDNEQSFDELEARIEATVAFLESAPADCMDGREGATIEVKTRDRVLTFSGRDYVLGFAVPNFFFHVTTAYDILRHKGVPLGKADFIGGGRR
jgi:hypothetical protein